MSKSLMSAKEVAARLGIAEKTCRSWIAQRRLPAVRIGRTVRIPAEAIEELIQASTTPALEDRG